MTQLEKWFDNDLNICERIMDWGTSDSQAHTPAYQIHADIIQQNFTGDWCWSEAIELWTDKAINQVVLAYEDRDEYFDWEEETA